METLDIWSKEVEMNVMEAIISLENPPKKTDLSERESIKSVQINKIGTFPKWDWYFSQEDKHKILSLKRSI